MDEDTKKCTCSCGSECTGGKCPSCEKDCECDAVAGEETSATDTEEAM